MATNIDQIIASQKELAHEISRLLANFPRDGHERKTPEKIKKRLQKLNQYWADFEKLHLDLKDSITEDHPYFEEKLYDLTYNSYKKAFDLITSYKPPQVSQGSSDLSAPLSVTSTKSITSCIVTTAATNNLTTNTTAVASYFQSLPSSIMSTTAQQQINSNVFPPSYGFPYQNATHNATNSWNPPQQLAPAYPYRDLHRSSNCPKLPPMQIPKFNGDYKDWKPFIDIFKNVIHNNLYISNVEKMQYLLYHLEGDARRVISHLQLSNHNYETALQLIEARFNNNRKIISTYVNTIIDAKAVEYRSQEDIIMLYDTIRECLEALKHLSYKTDDWGPMIVCIAMRKLDSESLRLFEESLLHPREMPSVSDLLQFLEKRYQVLDCIKNSKQQPKSSASKHFKKTFHATLRASCVICNKEHNLYQCSEFKKKNTDERQAFIRQKNICANCLAHNKNEKCKSNKLCAVCNKRHHTLLHRSIQNSTVPSNMTERNNVSTHMTTNVRIDDDSHAANNIISYHVNKAKFPNVLLPTAVVRVKNIYGQLEQFRALVDPGSQVSLITEEAVQILKVSKERIKATIFGVGESESAKTYSKVKVSIQLRHQKESYLALDALVLPKLNTLLPEAPATGIDINKFRNINLADPTFDKPGPIDLLLGADVYASILANGFKKGQPAAQNTKLGWLIFGSVPDSNQDSLKLSSFLSLAEIEDTLERFWDIENNQTRTQIDEACEQYFKTNHSRNEEGRYVVSLPFKDNIGTLGPSRHKAVARLLQMEKKLQRQPEVLTEYNNFLAEYLALGHMTPAKPLRGEESVVYYLPHHAVFKNDSSTTKLRVVFDASCKSESGLSLNDLLHCGPKIQQDLTQIMLRWRKYRYVFTADIEKMFRQILVTEADRNYQRILWRSDPTGPIKEFTLNTVTYGTGPATYLAVRTLQQLAEDQGSQYPIGQRVLTRDFYIDDMLTGAHTQADAINLQKQIIALLKQGGFNLRKWTSNSEELLKSIPEDLLEKGILEIKEDDTIKTLGIHWNPKHDEFQFKLKPKDYHAKLTKRTLLSKIASIFDPLGWLSPVTITAKLIMQSLCKTQTDWDEEAPLDITNIWNNLESELRELQAVKIPRWIHYRTQIQLHGFCDASEKGCAAVIYTRTTDSFGKIHTTLLTAKTKVAPLKQKISLPRLELCGAMLLANLLTSSMKSLNIDSPAIFAWCDSEITLAWIAKNPNTWHTYVANRVSEIQKLLPNTIWRHVPSKDNPADSATRGISPRKLASYNIWWRGPLWLSQPQEAWPSNKLNLVTEQEKRTNVHVHNTQVSCRELFNCSSFTRQVRVIAYCERFIKNCKLPRTLRNTGYLTSEELQCAKYRIIKVVQQEAFHEERDTLKRKGILKRSSKFLSLNPILDSNGILRVGGRLENSKLSSEAKHQILLPQKHHITNIIIDHAHQQTLHGGTKLTLSYVRSQYWIVNSTRMIQSRIHRCIKCLRFRQQTPQQLMGNLPATRITPSPPFSHCGVDYAGPFITKMSKGRGTKTTKGYIALFICMVTKAVHLELVTDLSTDAFLAAYRRFVARRGNAKQIISDNGTNFVGAHNKLDKDLQLAIAQSTRYAAELTANEGTDWSFIPAASPHFGGLWEAGVKSVKTHLKRVLGEALLTYEEFSTVLCRVEACLNSRPIGQLSSDPTDLEPLTPGHFLIGRPLLAPPEPEVSSNQINDKWKQIRKYHHDIWQRWSAEYLNTLQQRSKWRTRRENPSIGELVLLKDDNIPPQKWPLGRIVELHPGEDNIVRVVSVQNKNGIKKRPIHKLCQLPINIHNSETAELKATTSLTTVPKVPVKSSSRKRIYKEPEIWSKAEHFDRPTTDCNIRLPEPPKKRKKIKVAPCTWATKLLHTTLFILYWLTIVLAQDYEVVQPKTGIYIENLGIAQVKRGNLRLQISFPIEEIIEDQKMIDTTWEQIREMCRKNKGLTDITHCDVLFRHMSTRRINLIRATEQIIELAQHKSRRRRGLFGKILTSIFGVNDEVYTDIEHLQHNQENILQTMNQQVLFLNSKINQSNNIIEEKLKLFNARFTKVINSINEMTNWYTSADHNRISIEVITTYISAEDYYDELEDKYNRWLNALHEQGHLLNFISPQDINEIVANASERLSSNLFIARTPQHRLEVETENGTLKLYGYLNILEASTYQLMHITPIPQIIGNNSFAVIDLKTPTFAINFDQQAYFNLNNEELKACSFVKNHTYLCTATIVHNIDNSPSCIIDKIYDRHTPTDCEMQNIQLTGTIWKALMMKNTWLYITTRPKVVSMICGGRRTELLLNTTGIIHLRDMCFIRTKEVTLKTAIDQQFDVISSHIKETAPVKAVASSIKAPYILQDGVLIPPGDHILDHSSRPDLLRIDSIHRTLAAHTLTATIVILISFILAICTYHHWQRIKTMLNWCTFKGNQTTTQQSTPTAIQRRFDQVLTSAGPQHVRARTDDAQRC